MSSDSENLVALILINKYLLLKKQKQTKKYKKLSE